MFLLFKTAKTRQKKGATMTTHHVERGYLRRQDAAQYLSVSLRTLANLQASGEIPYSKWGRNVFLKKSDLDKFIEKHLVERNEVHK